MLILYTTEDGKSRIQLRAGENTVWLTQLEMADLFATTKQNISLHLQNIFEDGELREASVVKDSLTTATDGKAYTTKLYNLDAILAVGYRVRSPRGVQFRRWASPVAKSPNRPATGWDKSSMRISGDTSSSWIAPNCSIFSSPTG